MRPCGKPLRQEVIDLREIQEGYYFYENFFRIKQILSDPTIDTKEALRQVMKVLTDMGGITYCKRVPFF
jgi:hypothetical protein